MTQKTVLLTILDGWGIGDKCSCNAIQAANTPNFDSLMYNYPNTKIYADGNHVGLPKGQMGNSEVGHLNIGAGRIVYQELTRINKSIEDGDFFTNETLLKAIENAKTNNSSLHIMGLLSDGGVHSSLEHLSALLKLAKDNGLSKVFVHAFLDGRDTPPQSSINYAKAVDAELKSLGLPQIATVSGRYYAMDRDKRWDRLQKAYDCLFEGKGDKADNAEAAITKSYENGANDEFVLPTVTNTDSASRFNDNDSIIFFNFRPDRAREITTAINVPSFDGFPRHKVVKNIYYVCMTQYDESIGLPIAFPPQKLTNLLGDVFDKYDVKQFRTAETEKYAHITFFFNGGVEKAFKTETRVLVNSPKVATYDLQPEMSAYEVCEKVVGALKSKEYGFILVNFANPDMVGHTGVMSAAVKAIETIDNCLGSILEAVKETGTTMLLTADHGNAECMVDPETNEPFTAHTTNEVPFAVINADKEVTLRESGALCDIAPTILNLLGLEQPEEMTGKSMIL